MSNLEVLSGIRDFARAYAKGMTHHTEVRTEHLAEALRGFGGLSPFPTLAELRLFCRKLGIALQSLPPVVEGMDGVNIWSPKGPEIHVRDDLKQMRFEHTVCHEIREVVETAFKLENNGYVGLNTSDNKIMNPESDHFAGCLLMQADASKRLLRELGFDLLQFSRRTGRSLPSVVLRLQELYSSASGERQPTAGVWLFDAPWPVARVGKAGPGSMIAKYSAQLCGFSMRKGGSAQSLLARGLFPTKGSRLRDFGLGSLAVEEHHPVMADLRGFDMFEEQDYQVIAEPVFTRVGPWRLLVVAARKDGVGMFEHWISRLSIRTVIQTYQSVDRPSLN